MHLSEMGKKNKTKQKTNIINNDNEIVETVAPKFNSIHPIILREKKREK